MFHWERGRVFEDFSAIYVVGGEGEFESKTAGYHRIVAGSVMLLFPGEWHRYRPHLTTGWDEYWFNARGDYLESLVQEGFFIPEQPALRPGVDDTLLQAYLELLDLGRAEPTGFQQLAGATVVGILAAILAAVRRQGTTSRDEDRVRRAKAYLEENVEGVMSIPQLASVLHISAEHLRRLFRRHVGISPHEYYLQLKMHRARQLLRETALTVKQVAHRLRFESPYHFSKTFKRRTGVSPTRWRQVK
jgi:AraC-like DNA-binding protein